MSTIDFRAHHAAKSKFLRRIGVPVEPAAPFVREGVADASPTSPVQSLAESPKVDAEPEPRQGRWVFLW